MLHSNRELFEQTVLRTADATGIGNLLTQWIGRGLLKDLGEAREVCARSCEIKEYIPMCGGDMGRQYQTFLQQTKLK